MDNPISDAAPIREPISFPVYAYLNIPAVFIIVVVGAIAIYTVLQADYQTAIILGIFILFGCLLLLLSRSKIEADAERVVIHTPNGRYGMDWQEVEIIRFNGPNLALEGNDKRLVISLSYAGRSSKKFLELLDQQSMNRLIPIIRPGTFAPTHQNTRLK